MTNVGDLLWNDEEIKFFKKHRGGSGNVFVAFAIHENLGERTAVFSSIEKAEEWELAVAEDWRVVFVPMIVDDPDYGNVRAN